jgi:hypothetical protein
MEVDTGSFRALQARAGTMEALAADVAQIRQELASQLPAASFGAAMFDAAVAEGRRREAEERAPRHARPRRNSPAYLRLVTGQEAPR